jgi:hypothetical protein
MLAGIVGGGGGYPVQIPGSATSYPNLEQASGWAGDSTSDVSPNPPTDCAIVPPGNSGCPSTITGAGGGSTLTLQTTGPASLYSGWMAKLAVTTTGQLYQLLRWTVTLSAVAGIQALEVGRRATNAAGITDNGQTQFVPISGSLLEFDLVPSSSGGLPA